MPGLAAPAVLPRARGVRRYAGARPSRGLPLVAGRGRAATGRARPAARAATRVLRGGGCAPGRAASSRAGQAGAGRGGARRRTHRPGSGGEPARARGPRRTGERRRPAQGTPRDRQRRGDRARPRGVPAGPAGRPALGRRAARPGLRALRALGGGARTRLRVAERPRGARGGRRSAAGRSRDRPRRGCRDARRSLRPRGTGPASAPRLDAPGRPPRDDPGALSRRGAPRVGVAGDRRPGAGRGGTGERARLPASLGRAPRRAAAETGDGCGGRRQPPRLRPAAGRHELAARARSRAHGPDGPSRRPPQRLDPGVGGADARRESRPSLRRAGLPSPEGRARVLGEPAAAGGGRRSAAAGVRPRVRVQRGAPRQPALVGPRGAAPGATRQR